jgi:membrane protease YdiL (CAAX protease family)
LKKEFPERFSPLNYAYERALVYKDMGKRMEEKKALLEVLALTSAEKEYYGRRTTTASFLQLSYYRYANNRLLEIDLLNADYAAASRRYVSQKSLNYILGIAILGFLFPALFTGIFFIIFRIFFLKKEQDVRSSLYRLRHLFLFGVIVFLTPPLLYHILLTSNYIFAFLTFFKTHPLLLTELLAQLIIVVAVTYIYKRILHKTNDELGIRLNALKPILKISLSLALFFVALNIGILKILDYFSIKPTQTLFEKMFKELLGDKQPGTQVVMYANIILFAPIAEELRFRLFLNDYIRKYTNIIFAVIVSSAFFALGHGLGFVFIHFFIMGIVLSVIYFKYKSVLPCIATHMFYNFFIILIWLLNEIYKIF